MPRKSALKSKSGRQGGGQLTDRQKRQVKSMISRRIETKIFDTSLLGTSVVTGGTILGPFSVPVQGPADGQRVSDRIMLKDLMVNWEVKASDDTNIVRIVIFQWRSNNASVSPTASVLLQNPGNPIHSSINDTNVDGGLFTVLADKRYTLVINGSNRAVARRFKFFGRRIPRKRVTFNPSATTGFNHIYAAVWSDSVLGPNPTYDYYTRIHYIDA